MKRGTLRRVPIEDVRALIGIGLLTVYPVVRILQGLFAAHR